MTYISTRYFILLVKDKKDAKVLLEKIKSFLKEKLKLNLNRKTRYYPNKFGVDFCGYITYETHKKLRKRCIKKIKKKVKKWNYYHNESNLDTNKVLMQWNSFKGHIMHANSYNLKRKIFEKMNFKDYVDL